MENASRGGYVERLRRCSEGDAALRCLFAYGCKGYMALAIESYVAVAFIRDDADAALVAEKIIAPVAIMGIILPVYTIIDMIETAENVWSDSCVSAMTDHDIKK